MREKNDMSIWAGGDWRSLKNAKIWVNGGWRDFGTGANGTAIWADGDWNRIAQPGAPYRFASKKLLYIYSGRPSNQPQPTPVVVGNTLNPFDILMHCGTWSGGYNTFLSMLQFLRPEDLIDGSGNLMQILYKFVNNEPAAARNVPFRMAVIDLDLQTVADDQFTNVRNLIESSTMYQDFGAVANGGTSLLTMDITNVVRQAYLGGGNWAVNNLTLGVSCIGYNPASPYWHGPAVGWGGREMWVGGSLYGSSV